MEINRVITNVIHMKIKRALPIFIIMLLISCSRPTDSNTMNTDAVVLKDLQGKKVDLENYRGKTIFLNLWATWCAPCIREMPSIEHASTILKDENIVFLFASDESADRIQKFAKDKGFTVPLIRIESIEAMNIQALPTTLIFDGDGTLVYSEVGYRLWDSPESIELIRKYTEEK
jgi:thiol-disulfide isomerase/thioredoxin